MDISFKPAASSWRSSSASSEAQLFWPGRDYLGSGKCESYLCPGYRVNLMYMSLQPGETLKSLTEARRSLEEARKEIKESRERAQIRTTHTFAPLPGFFSRPAELRAIRRILEGSPAFTVLSGASSVGKTALLREVLSEDRYHVLHLDLRIAGFADLSSLYLSLNRQMEQYFDTLSKDEGYEEFEKDAWGFKVRFYACF